MQVTGRSNVYFVTIRVLQDGAMYRFVLAVSVSRSYSEFVN